MSLRKKKKLQAKKVYTHCFQPS